MNVDKAIAGNRRYAAQGIWVDRFPQILEVLEVDRTCAERGFARAVGAWQETRPPLQADGILGPKTWTKFDPETRFSTVAVQPPPWLYQCIASPVESDSVSTAPRAGASGAAAPSPSPAVPNEKWRSSHLANAAADDIPADLWRAAMRSRDHCMTLGKLQDKGHDWLKAELKRPDIVTLVDFRITSKEIRLWTVVLKNGAAQTKFRLHVSHGKRSAKGNQSRGPAARVGNRYHSNMSSVGGYVTTYRTGFSKKFLGEPSLRVIGIDRTNDNAGGRNIIFHAASYVSERSGAGRSKGCFATTKAGNRQLLEFIKGGTFVYAYFGDDWLEPRD